MISKSPLKFISTLGKVIFGKESEKPSEDKPVENEAEWRETKCTAPTQA
jgi:hypothetical protein